MERFIRGSANQETVYDNGTKKAKKVLKKGVDWYDGQKNRVIAIDFGTSTLAVAWLDEGGQIYDLPIQEGKKYIPTVLLIKGNNRTEVGERALVEFGKQLEDNSAIIFEKIKMELQHTKVNY